MTHWVDRAVAAEAEVLRLQAVVDDLTVNPRDEHHTLDELYQYRMLYNAFAVNAWAAADTHPVVKSWTHADGEPCFGGGWFIVVATLPTGQVSNHYRAEHWDLFRIPEGIPPIYDFQSPAIAADRMLASLRTKEHTHDA
ncbi:hypothetical protein [Curtobacterium sp. MCSS17_016]|uniref:WDGH domain-containing protein n=1 Tax=Curtobacterium sp. MCSS17_016 TaxID=2175644 RepID=UPI000DAA3B04|nr:hypothetical protein [Curtobacterium sp. MCSS17_016]WIE81367.1 hypothetical protein DEJ19_019220 [Curtobacterium sp. MCSS17_016]